MSHHECKHMAAHLGNAGKKSLIAEDRPETAAPRQVDKFTHEVQTPDEDVSSQSMKHVHRDGGQQGADGHGMGSMRIELLLKNFLSTMESIQPFNMSTP